MSRDPIGYLTGPTLSLLGEDGPTTTADPSGLATLKFEPNPWWLVDWYLAPLPVDPRTGRQMEGATITDEAYVECVCEYCKAGKSDLAMCGAKPKCEVFIKIKHILIHNGLDEALRPWVYGHEQLHVANIKKIGLTIRDTLTREENKIGCQTPARCKSHAAHLANEAQREMQKAFDREQHHDIYEHPKDGQHYWPPKPYPKKPKGTIDDPGIKLPK